MSKNRSGTYFKKCVETRHLPNQYKKRIRRSKNTNMEDNSKDFYYVFDVKFNIPALIIIFLAIAVPLVPIWVKAIIGILAIWSCVTVEKVEVEEEDE